MSSTVQPNLNLKLLLIGNSSVGKSSLLLRFTDNEFLTDEETAATIGVDFKVKSIELDGKKYKLSVWDTAGQERFRTLTSSYYRGAQGVVLVYDVSSRPTFDELLKWFKEIDTYCGEGVVKMIVGNKVDKEFSRQVTTEEGKAFAERMGALFIECSAKTRLGVPEAFEELVRRILATPTLYSKSTAAPTRKTEPIRLEEESWTGGGCSC
ncbi:uncharacterized protein I303_101165 [Kwoniella dejecticola CBS 10117]|uniref:Uncharacterized protein n=1 Tax=Kwoniella dejecticola CBS 10117 TaxID=1296121 RepID=A0A1A6AGY5_9TREE|nr:uncharacterized protein I303_01172 [Kwoniella dejecticola CBS 10117]OBR89345.1 hypothetical protein I303_01172 [Kwoniella dejecticola CBS 10117]